MDTRSQTNDSFLGLYLPSDLKDEVCRQADAEGLSISEFVRRNLDEMMSQEATA